MKVKQPIRQVALYMKNEDVSNNITMITPVCAKGLVTAAFSDILGVNEANKPLQDTNVITATLAIEAHINSNNLKDLTGKEVLLYKVGVVYAEISYDNCFTSEKIDYELDDEDKEVLKMALAEALAHYPNYPLPPITAPSLAALEQANILAPTHIELRNHDSHDGVTRLDGKAEGEFTVFVDDVPASKLTFEATFKEEFKLAKYLGRTMIEDRVDGLTNIDIHTLLIGDEIEDADRHDDVDIALYQYNPSRQVRKALALMLTRKMPHF